MATEIVVHRPSPSGGGRRVTVGGVDFGLARDDHDLVEFLRRAGLDEADRLVSGDSPIIQWRGGRAHEYEAVGGYPGG
ncbi:hypothetical protein OG785_39290 [Streptomyces sp. NBC_00006]|uniref:hypothetical protein n=1 Tax=Streptomyces sp. NBC_00006 TaxID=2975619 RepID=UPI00224E3E99|nr:hypothetical protein [Streptomyces sp. NBC_00006]MCX5536594.1 hypothetical protein [Streptomyces sp. NBC_00006]